MSRPPDPVGTLEVALAHATRLLETQPKLAADQAQEILKVLPSQPTALLLLGLYYGDLLGADGLMPVAANGWPRSCGAMVERVTANVLCRYLSR
jgi:hypothetical protein